MLLTCLSPMGGAPAQQKHLLKSCAHYRSPGRKFTFLVSRVDLGTGMDVVHGESAPVCSLPSCPLLTGGAGDTLQGRVGSPAPSEAPALGSLDPPGT